MTRIVIFLALGLTLLWAGPAWTESEVEPAPEKESVVPLGTQTRAWLERQRTGTEQSRNPHGLTPPEEHRAVKRHLDSFDHPIPPLFEFEELGGSD